MKNEQDIISDFFRKFYPTAYGVLLSGSCVDQQQHSTSDVDTMVFVTEFDKCFNEDFDYRGKKIQIIVIATQLLPALLQQDYMLGTGNQIGMIAKGIVIHEKNRYLTDLVAYCKKLYKSGPPRKSAEQLRLLKLDIIQLYQKLHSNQFEENFFQVTDLSMKLALYNLYYHRWWASNRKFLFEQLKTLNPNLQKSLFEATTSFFNTKSTERLIEFTKENLLSLGELEDLNSVNTGYTIIHGDKLLISMNIKNSEYSIVYTVLREFLFEIFNKYKTNYYMYRTFANEHQLQEFDNIIIVLKGENYILNKLLIDLNSIRSSPKYDLIGSIRYPINIDVSLGFQKNKYLIIESLFFKIYEFILSTKEILTNTEKILFSIDFIQAIGKLSFKNTESFNIFLKYVYNCWLPKSYDSGQIYGFHQIIDVKDKVEKAFKDSSKLQIPNLISIFQSIHLWNKQGFVILPEDLYANTKSALQKAKQVKDATYNSFELHPVFDFLPAKTNFSSYVFLKNTFERLLGILSIEESHKAYVIYLVRDIFNKGAKTKLNDYGLSAHTFKSE